MDDNRDPLLEDEPRLENDPLLEDETPASWQKQGMLLLRAVKITLVLMLVALPTYGSYVMMTTDADDAASIGEMGEKLANIGGLIQDMMMYLPVAILFIAVLYVILALADQKSEKR